MKATKYIQTLILTPILCLHAGFIFADGTDAKPMVNNIEIASYALINLAPSTPVEATFEEFIPVYDFAALAPTPPVEATFEDIIGFGNGLMLDNLAPVTPLEADFNDNEVFQKIDISTLAPKPLAVADFEDLS
jgi:hypothetical protein